MGVALRVWFCCSPPAGVLDIIATLWPLRGTADEAVLTVFLNSCVLRVCEDTTDFCLSLALLQILLVTVL